MARQISISELLDDRQKNFSRSLQSANINYLIGSGASLPSIPLAGDVESQIATLTKAGANDEVLKLMFSFLKSVQEPCERVLADKPNQNDEESIQNYRVFLSATERILLERDTELLPKQATIFTTNYDLFVERASEDVPGLILNDGFARAPSLKMRMAYSPQNFFTSTYNTGSLYGYRVETPSVNLVKMHGSMTWTRGIDDAIIFDPTLPDLPVRDAAKADTENYVGQHVLVLPEIDKFRQTTMDKTYYDLLRIFHNQLDRENSLLICFGFSFEDAHILDITERALQNATLRCLVFAYDDEKVNAYLSKFEKFNNVIIVSPEDGENIGFEKFNDLLKSPFADGD